MLITTQFRLERDRYSRHWQRRHAVIKLAVESFVRANAKCLTGLELVSHAKDQSHENPYSSALLTLMLIMLTCRVLTVTTTQCNLTIFCQSARQK